MIVLDLLSRWFFFFVLCSTSSSAHSSSDCNLSIFGDVSEYWLLSIGYVFFFYFAIDKSSAQQTSLIKSNVSCNTLRVQYDSVIDCEHCSKRFTAIANGKANGRKKRREREKFDVITVRCSLCVRVRCEMIGRRNEQNESPTAHSPSLPLPPSLSLFDSARFCFL